jgi:hypothetical protein
MDPAVVKKTAVLSSIWTRRTIVPFLVILSAQMRTGSQTQNYLPR